MLAVCGRELGCGTPRRVAPLRRKQSREQEPVHSLIDGVWGAAATGYTGYRLVARGYLPYAEQVAKRTGLHDRIGPGGKDDEP